MKPIIAISVLRLLFASAALGAAAPTSMPSVWPDQTNGAVRWERLFERDKEGFTIFPLGEGARLILISSSEGSDFNDGQLRPVRTLQKALSLTRIGVPDRILFKRGDVFLAAQLQASIHLAGRSILEPMIFGAYGDQRQPRPILQAGFYLGGRTASRFLVFQSLDFYDAGRDPSVPGFDPTRRPADGPGAGIFMLTAGSYLWIEDCAMRFFSSGMALQCGANQFHNVIIRRCAFTDAYGAKGHPQGIYVDGPDNVLIEQNLFDHNGWNDSVKGGQKTIFNHNMYLQYSKTGEDLAYIVRDNISARASSHGCQMRPGGLLENNLFLKNARAAFVASSPSLVRNNVILDGDDIGSGLPRGQGLEFLNCPIVLAEGNIFAHKKDPRNREQAMAYNPLVRDRFSGPSHGEFRNNIVYDWTGEAFSTASPSADLNLHDNYFQQDGLVLIELSQWNPQYRIIDNHYQLLHQPQFMIGEQRMDFAQWSGKTGDNSSTAPVQFVDPGRDISTYSASIGLTETSLEGFLAAARQQRRGHWDDHLTAAAVNDYIRAGFQIKSGGASP
jgi:hypothetical protein